jgi:hypothetical protein
MDGFIILSAVVKLQYHNRQLLDLFCHIDGVINQNAK